MLDESGGRLYENNEAAQRAASRAQNRTVRLTAFGGSLTASPRDPPTAGRGARLETQASSSGQKGETHPERIGMGFAICARNRTCRLCEVN
jgi:hypothetical protein